MLRTRTEVKKEIKFDTNNYIEEVKGWHYAEEDEEALYCIEQLKKHLSMLIITQEKKVITFMLVTQ